MSVLGKVRRFFQTDGQTVELYDYECNDCGDRFESAKSPDRAQCMECLSNDVERSD